MKIFYHFFRRIILFFFLLIPLFCCEKEKDDGLTEEQRKNVSVSDWIYENMKSYYFWNYTFPEDISGLDKTNPPLFFDALVYNQADKWSFITNNYEESDSVQFGAPLTMGYSPRFYRINGTDLVFIAVEYVYPKSPAARAGMKRGDLIVMIDSEFLTTKNYYQLFIKPRYTAKFGTIRGNTIYPSSTSVTMLAGNYDADPLLFSTILKLDNKQIGYIVYTSFDAGYSNNYLSNLKVLIKSFQEAGIDDLIVDLRYNHGGQLNVATEFASLIAPASVVSNAELFASLEYNEELQARLLETEGAESENLKVKFKMGLYNLNLKHITFLTTKATASASELLITGLEPYMDVTIIGESTSGKYTGSWVICDTNTPKEHDWLIMPIVFRYANADGYTNFNAGLKPDYYMNDDVAAAKPFGNINDPMLAYALEIINGTIKKSTSSASIGSSYEELPNIIDKNAGQLFAPCPMNN